MWITRDVARLLADALLPFRSDYEHGPFGDGSLYAKALNSIGRREQDDQQPPGTSDDRARTSPPSR
jgi:hypothetical protein